MQTGFYFSQMPLVNRGSDTLKVKVSQVYMVMVSVTIKQTSLNQQQVTEAGRMAMSRKANAQIRFNTLHHKDGTLENSLFLKPITMYKR